MILRVHHTQVSIPKGTEDQARKFYCELLGLKEVEKPESLKGRGGFWLTIDDHQVHFGTEDGVDPRATKSHVAYEVKDLHPWKERLRQSDVEILDGIPIPGYDRFEFRDPFGNRVEFLQSNKVLPQLRTERLVLRLPMESDVASILQFFLENEARFAPTDPPKLKGFNSESFWRNHVIKAHSEFYNDQALRLLIFKGPENGPIVGRINFTQMFRGPFQACNLGYAIDGKCEGQGFMAEALRSAIAYVFDALNFHRIMVNHLPENERSARLLNRLGFVIINEAGLTVRPKDDESRQRRGDPVRHGGAPARQIDDITVVERRWERREHACERHRLIVRRSATVRATASTPVCDLHRGSCRAAPGPAETSQRRD